MIKFKEINKISEMYYVSILLEELKNYYPNIKEWFINSVFPTVWLGNSKIFLMKKNNKTIGLLILKDEEEKKIRSLYILKKYRNKGLVLKLFNYAMEILKTNKPKYSVPEELLDFYKKIAKYYGHTITYKKKGIYRKEKTEYFFN